MSKVGIIADDFTGANDVGIQFRKYGLRTLSLFDASHLHQLVGELDVIVIDTESRYDPSKIAYQKVGRAARVLKDLKVEKICKKIDSTFRGNIGSENDALMDEWGVDFMAVVPALPVYGRVTMDGFHYVNKVLLEETEFAQDPINPVRDSFLPTLLQRQTKRKVGLVDLELIRGGVDSLRKGLAEQKRLGSEMVILDSETQEDLKIVAKALAEAPLVCGSAGLASELPEAWRLKRSLKPQGDLEIGFYPKPSGTQRSVLVLAGSVSEVTLKQIYYTQERMEVEVIYLEASKLLKSNKEKRTEIEKALSQAREAIRGKRDLIIYSAKSKKQVELAKRIGKELGLEDVEVSDRIAQVYGAMAKELVIKDGISRIYLVGGNTAINVCKALRINGMEILDEVLPAIPSGISWGGEANLYLVTKAGGFGREEALAKGIEYLRRW